MRIIVRFRGVDVFDLDLRLPIREPEPEPEQPPVLQAAAHPVDVSRAEPMEAPDCTVMHFGFGR